MKLTADLVLSDVAAIFIQQERGGSFGAGRLIAPSLILTARHVVDFPNAHQPESRGWKVRLMRERSNKPYDATVVWRSPDPRLDLALLRLDESESPALEIVFASYDLLEPLNFVDATGFPEAVWDIGGTARDYTVRGTLRIVTQNAPLAFTVPPADKPSDPHKWGGMSGANVFRIDAAGRLHLFGAVQQVPGYFQDGMLEVARLDAAFQDQVFYSLLASSFPLGVRPRLTRWIESSINAIGACDDSNHSNRASSMVDVRARIRREINRRRKEEDGPCEL
jgi:hypothetical protein